MLRTEGRMRAMRERTVLSVDVASVVRVDGNCFTFVSFPLSPMSILV